MTCREFSPTPPSLFDNASGKVNWGTFKGQVKDCNLIEIPGMYSSFDKNDKRLKEWQAFQLGDGDQFICGAVYNAKQFAVIALAYYQRSTNTHHLYKKFVRPSRISVANGRLPSVTQFSHKNNEPRYRMTRNTESGCDIDIYWPASGKLPELKLHAKLQDNFSGMSICQPFASQRPLYSYKNVMKASADIQLGTRIHHIQPDNGYAIIDDHKGYYPKEVNYDWGTAADHVDGRLIGFNLTRNQIINQEEYNENCLWIDNSLYLLPAVTVTHHHDHWHYQDKNGDIDLKFYPQVKNNQKFHLGFVYMNYQGPFGYFEGHISHPDSGRIVINNMLGMAERKRYKL